MCERDYGEVAGGFRVQEVLFVSCFWGTGMLGRLCGCLVRQLQAQRAHSFVIAWVFLLPGQMAVSVFDKSVLPDLSMPPA